MIFSESLYILSRYAKANRLSITRSLITASIVISFLIILFQHTIEAIFFNGGSTIINHFAVLTIAGVALYIQLSEKKINSNLLILSAITIYIIMVSILLGVSRPLLLIVAQSYLHLQLFILAIAVLIIYKKFPGFFLKIFKTVVVISSIGVLFQLINPQIFQELFPPSERVLLGLDRGYFRIWGFQVSPNRLGLVYALFLVLIIFKKEIFQNNYSRVFFILVSIASLVLSGSRSAMLYVIIAIFFSGIKLSNKIYITTALTSLLFIFGVLDYLKEKTTSNFNTVVETSIDDTQYIRWLMTYHGAEIAIDFFPIGTGAATFGTGFSVGSPVYSYVGISDLPTVIEGRGIHDSNFGSIMGEFGFIGFIIFYGFGIYLVLIILRQDMLHFSKQKKLFFISICIIGFVATFMRPLFLSNFDSALFLLLLFGYIETSKKQGISIELLRTHLQKKIK